MSFALRSGMENQAPRALTRQNNCGGGANTARGARNQSCLSVEFHPRQYNVDMRVKIT